MTADLWIAGALMTLALGFFYVGTLAGRIQKLKYYFDKIESLEKENHRLYWKLIQKGNFTSDPRCGDCEEPDCYGTDYQEDYELCKQIDHLPDAEMVEERDDDTETD